MTLITALRQDGVTASLVLDDPSSAIPRYVKEVHVPAPSPGYIVLIENLEAMSTKRSIEALATSCAFKRRVNQINN
jgi:hypothetical protein